MATPQTIIDKYVAFAKEVKGLEDLISGISTIPDGIDTGIRSQVFSEFYNGFDLIWILAVQLYGDFDDRTNDKQMVTQFLSSLDETVDKFNSASTVAEYAYKQVATLSE